MRTYAKRLWVYHRRFLRLYGLLMIGVYGVYLWHLPTPLSLLLKPLGLHSWSAGLTRASVQVMQGHFSAAWAYNPLIFPLLAFMLSYVFVFPLLPAARRQFDWENQQKGKEKAVFKS
ncbi:DUF2752 domain-containing protein [Streptococcus sp. DD12]|uniref:DUF2752 domain-containing protein n=1 Tax=Streptococcus sp. DD12 TaxID=1777880 RepID=UPI00079337A5|nr:DUF2752 domain-containing protein [Streptococcus sp. DD12]KXT75498.1 hypothetical protein STRDD12_01309 [Streptococcus sp. DD12]